MNADKEKLNADVNLTGELVSHRERGWFRALALTVAFCFFATQLELGWIKSARAQEGGAEVTKSDFDVTGRWGSDFRTLGDLKLDFLMQRVEAVKTLLRQEQKAYIERESRNLQLEQEPYVSLGQVFQNIYVNQTQIANSAASIRQVYAAAVSSVIENLANVTPLNYFYKNGEWTYFQNGLPCKSVRKAPFEGGALLTEVTHYYHNSDRLLTRTVTDYYEDGEGSRVLVSKESVVTSEEGSVWYAVNTGPNKTNAYNLIRRTEDTIYDYRDGNITYVTTDFVNDFSQRKPVFWVEKIRSSDKPYNTTTVANYNASYDGDGNLTAVTKDYADEAVDQKTGELVVQKKWTEFWSGMGYAGEGAILANYDIRIVNEDGTVYVHRENSVDADKGLTTGYYERVTDQFGVVTEKESSNHYYNGMAGLETYDQKIHIYRKDEEGNVIFDKYFEVNRTDSVYKEGRLVGYTEWMSNELGLRVEYNWRDMVYKMGELAGYEIEVRTVGGIPGEYIDKTEFVRYELELDKYGRKGKEVTTTHTIAGEQGDGAPQLDVTNTQTVIYMAYHLNGKPMDYDVITANSAEPGTVIKDSYRNVTYERGEIKTYTLTHTESAEPDKATTTKVENTIDIYGRVCKTVENATEAGPGLNVHRTVVTEVKGWDKLGRRTNYAQTMISSDTPDKTTEKEFTIAYDATGQVKEEAVSSRIIGVDADGKVIFDITESASTYYTRDTAGRVICWKTKTVDQFGEVTIEENYAGSAFEAIPAPAAEIQASPNGYNGFGQLTSYRRLTQALDKNGNVKSTAEQYVYLKYDGYGRTVEQTTGTIKDGRIVWVTEKTNAFNGLGQVTNMSRTTLYDEGLIEREEIKNAYDAYGRLSWERIDRDGPQGPGWLEETYAYNSVGLVDGKCAKEQNPTDPAFEGITYQEYKVSYKYNSHGQITLEKAEGWSKSPYGEHVPFTSYTAHVYDTASGYLIKTHLARSDIIDDGRIIETELEQDNTYREGKLSDVHTVKSISDTTTTFKYETSYETGDKVITETTIKNNRRVTESSVHYEYDERGDIVDSKRTETKSSYQQDVIRDRNDKLVRKDSKVLYQDTVTTTFHADYDANTHLTSKTSQAVTLKDKDGNYSTTESVYEVLSRTADLRVGLYRQGNCTYGKVGDTLLNAEHYWVRDDCNVVERDNAGRPTYTIIDRTDESKADKSLPAKIKDVILYGSKETEEPRADTRSTVEKRLQYYENGRVADELEILSTKEYDKSAGVWKDIKKETHYSNITYVFVQGIGYVRNTWDLTTTAELVGDYQAELDAKIKAIEENPIDSADVASAVLSAWSEMRGPEAPHIINQADLEAKINGKIEEKTEEEKESKINGVKSQYSNTEKSQRISTSYYPAGHRWEGLPSGWKDNTFDFEKNRWVDGDAASGVTYDVHKQMTSMAQGNNAYSYYYNSDGQIDHISYGLGRDGDVRGGGGTVTYIYDNYGNLTGTIDQGAANLKSGHRKGTQTWCTIYDYNFLGAKNKNDALSWSETKWKKQSGWRTFVSAVVNAVCSVLLMIPGINIIAAICILACQAAFNAAWSGATGRNFWRAFAVSFATSLIARGAGSWMSGTDMFGGGFTSFGFSDTFTGGLSTFGVSVVSNFASGLVEDAIVTHGMNHDWSAGHIAWVSGLAGSAGGAIAGGFTGAKLGARGGSIVTNITESWSQGGSYLYPVVLTALQTGTAAWEDHYINHKRNELKEQYGEDSKEINKRLEKYSKNIRAVFAVVGTVINLATAYIANYITSALRILWSYLFDRDFVKYETAKDGRHAMNYRHRDKDGTEVCWTTYYNRFEDIGARRPSETVFTNLAADKIEEYFKKAGVKISKEIGGAVKFASDVLTGKGKVVVAYDHKGEAREIEASEYFTKVSLGKFVSSVSPMLAEFLKKALAINDSQLEQTFNNSMEVASWKVAENGSVVTLNLDKDTGDALKKAGIEGFNQIRMDINTGSFSFVRKGFENPEALGKFFKGLTDELGVDESDANALHEKLSKLLNLIPQQERDKFLMALSAAVTPGEGEMVFHGAEHGRISLDLLKDAKGLWGEVRDVALARNRKAKEIGFIMDKDGTSWTDESGNPIAELRLTNKGASDKDTVITGPAFISYKQTDDGIKIVGIRDGKDLEAGTQLASLKKYKGKELKDRLTPEVFSKIENLRRVEVLEGGNGKIYYVYAYGKITDRELENVLGKGRLEDILAGDIVTEINPDTKYLEITEVLQDKVRITVLVRDKEGIVTTYATNREAGYTLPEAEYGKHYDHGVLRVDLSQYGNKLLFKDVKGRAVPEFAEGMTAVVRGEQGQWADISGTGQLFKAGSVFKWNDKLGTFKPLKAETNSLIIGGEKYLPVRLGEGGEEAKYVYTSRDGAPLTIKIDDGQLVEGAYFARPDGKGKVLKVVNGVPVQWEGQFKYYGPFEVITGFGRRSGKEPQLLIFENGQIKNEGVYLRNTLAGGEANIFRTQLKEGRIQLVDVKTNEPVRLEPQAMQKDLNLGIKGKTIEGRVFEENKASAAAAADQKVNLSRYFVSLPATAPDAPILDKNAATPATLFVTPYVRPADTKTYIPNQSLGTMQVKGGFGPTSVIAPQNNYWGIEVGMRNQTPFGGRSVVPTSSDMFNTNWIRNVQPGPTTLKVPELPKVPTQGPFMPGQ